MVFSDFAMKYHDDPFFEKKTIFLSLKKGSFDLMFFLQSELW